MATITVRQIKPEQWAAYRDIRLAALEDSPDAFSSTLAQAQKLSNLQCQQRLSALNGELYLAVFAYHRANIVGLSWGLMEQNTAQVYQMWVAPPYRGVGASKAMLNSIVSWACENAAQSIQLSVTQTNVAAVGLYMAAGFVETGVVQPLREGSLLQVVQMKLSL